MSQLRNQKVVKIFFSSPFGGMEEEREELTRRYFPSIQHLCNSFGLQFVAVDMRWGITSESSDKSQVINICLREIDRSDMFVGFFGQRYGWHGADDASLQKNFDNALLNYPWLDEVRDKSVTELEFLHGFLNNPGQLPATLFFRDKLYDGMMRDEGLKKGDKKQVFKYSPESEHSTQLMDNLKERVLQHADKSLGVHMAYKTPAEAAKIMYDTIMTFLTETLLADLSTEKLSLRAELTSQHDAFLASRADIYIGGEKYLQQLDNKLLSENDRHVLVTGEAGCGKSALISNWINLLKHTHDNYVVFYHFIGFADESTDITNMLMRCVEEFAFVVSKLVDGEPREKIWEKLPDDKSEKTMHVINELLTLIDRLIRYGKTPILVFDGLEKLMTVSKIKKVLFWLPANFPPSCFVVVATKLTDLANIEELKSRNYSALELEALTHEYKRDLCVKVLQKSGKELSSEQLDCIVNASMTRNPLFLRITLSELVAFGYFRLLDKKILSLISSESIVALFLQVLNRLEEDYNVADYTGNLVEQVMTCVYLSSQGISEMEMKELFSIPDHIWSPLYFAIEDLVIDQSGRIQYGFSELGQAVDQRYLQDEDKRNHYINILVEYYEANLKAFDLVSYLSEESQTMCRPAYELPSLYLKLEDTEKLAICLSNFFIFTHLQKNYPYQLVELWRHTRLSGSEIRDKLMTSMDNCVADLYIHMEMNDTLKTDKPPGFQLLVFIECIYEFLDTSGYRDEKIEVVQRAMAISEDAFKNECVQNKQHCEQLKYQYKYKLACIYSESYHSAEQGIKLHEEIIDYYQRLLDSGGSSMLCLSGLSKSYHGIGVAFMTLHEYEKVEDITLKAIQCIEESQSADVLSHLATSWSNLGLSFCNLDEPEKALKYFDKSIEAYEKIHSSEDPPVIGEILTNKGLCLRKLGNLGEAEQIYKRALYVKMKGVGRVHGTVAKSYLNLGTLELYQSNYESALNYYTEAKEIYEDLEQTWDNSEYIAVLENILVQYMYVGKYKEADEQCLTLFNWRVKDKSVDRCAFRMYIDMARYYLREGQFEKTYLLASALVDSVHSEYEDFVPYILLDLACGKLPSEYREKLPEKFTIQYMVERHPDSPNLVKQMIIEYFVPENNLDEISKILNVHAEITGAQSDIYNLVSEHWCRDKNGEINLQCRHRMLQDGLLKYPDSLELHLSMAKCCRHLGDHKNSLLHVQRVVDGQYDNPPLMMFTAETALAAREFDVCSKWCSLLEENFTDEAVRNGVTSIREALEKVRQEMQNEQNADSKS